MAPQNQFSIGIGPRIRKSPFFDCTVEEGVSHFSVYNHMYMPIAYGDVMAEYQRLMNGVSIWDVGGQRQVAFKGADVIALARLITSRNLDKLTIGQGMYVPMCNSRGTLINDPILLQISDDEIWLSIADNDMKYWCEAIAFGHGLDVQVFEPDVSPLAVQGPKAIDVARGLFGDWITGLKYFGFRETELNGIPLVVARSGWSKQGGYELYLRDGTKGKALWDIVMEAGRPFDIGPGAPNYIERVESGLISVNADTDDDANPFEMGLSKYVDLDQDVQFIGKEALKKIKADGIKRHFCGLFIDGTPLQKTNSHQWAIHQDGGYVGFASAAAYSPKLDKNISLALITDEAFNNNRSVIVTSEEGMRTAVVTSLPFKKGHSSENNHEQL